MEKFVFNSLILIKLLYFFLIRILKKTVPQERRFSTSLPTNIDEGLTLKVNTKISGKGKDLTIVFRRSFKMSIILHLLLSSNPFQAAPD